jgi:hypothetical protein
VDQKRLDAIEALSMLRDGRISPPRTLEHYPATMYARTLLRRTLCEPFICDQEWLPAHERLVLGARMLGPAYLRLKTLATIMAVAHGARGGTAPPSGETTYDLLPEDVSLPEDLRACIAVINRKLQAAALPSTLVDREQRLLRLLAGPPTVERGGDQRSEYSHEARTERYIALLWTFVKSIFDETQVRPSAEVMRPYSDQIRVLHGLETKNALDRWCATLGFSKSQYMELVATAFAFDYLVLRNNGDCVAAAAVMDTQFWLHQAILLTGANKTIERLMHDGAALRARRDALLALGDAAPDGLRAMDFRSAAELEAFITAAVAAATGADDSATRPAGPSR